MHNRMFRMLRIMLFPCVFLLVQIGCSRGVDIGRITNPNGQLEQTVDASTLTAYKAAMDALRELNMSLVGEYHGDASVDMKTESPDRTIAWIEITSVSAASCKVAVGVDVLSDESRSRTILTAILKNLPNESAASEMRPIKDGLNKRSENSILNPQHNEEGLSPADTKEPEKIKPLPQEVVTEKNLL